jgi:hypothetical protein
MVQDPESARLEEAHNAKAPWKTLGPYLSERQWGTVREDYSKCSSKTTTSMSSWNMPSSRQKTFSSRSA